MIVYYLEIESWENDGDAPKVNRFFDINKEHLEYLKKFLENFKTSSLGGMGNENISDEELQAFTEEYTSEHWAPADLMINFTPGNIRSLIQRTLGISENYSYNHVRALEKAEINEITTKELNAYLNFRDKVRN